MADDSQDKNNKDQGGDEQKNQPKVLLIAHVKAHLVNGEAFDLLPIKHEEDVKGEVNALIESWAKTGFLLRGRHIYPWHQVKNVEVLDVEELPLREAHLRLEELYAADRARMQESFWRTKKKSGKPGGNDKKDKDESKSQH